MNCETDFVAKNTKFKELVSRLTKDFATVSQVEESPKMNSIQKYVLNQDRIPKENEQISEAITHLGEKIEIKKAYFIKNHFDDPSICLVGYAHSTEGLNNTIDDVTFGKYGTIVALKQLPFNQSNLESEDDLNNDLNNDLNESNDDQLRKDEFSDDEDCEPLDFDTAAKQICQHIIVAAPEKVRKDPSEQNDLSSVIDEDNSNKDENQKDKLMKPNVLIEQEFLHSDYDTVEHFLKANNLEVIDFVRVKCGDE